MSQFTGTVEQLKNAVNKSESLVSAAEINEAVNKIQTITEHIYPIGSIYMSFNSTDPYLLFGGTWERIAKGQTLVGVDDADTDFSTVEKSGGEKTHILTTDEMPEHNHRPKGWAYQFVVGSGSEVCLRQSDETDNWASTTTSTGGGLAHNNMPPYITCFIWKRIS